MNAALAIDAYSKIKNETHSEERVGHDVIGAALKQLKTNLHILTSSYEKKDRVKAFERALVTIYFLQKGLDLSKGGDLAKNLFRLYEFCRLTVIKNGIENCRESLEIESCEKFISDIFDSWSLISKV